MAYRKTYRSSKVPRSSKSYRSGKSSFRAGDYVPTWTQSNTDAVTLIFQELMARIGVTDVQSYFERLKLPIACCVVAGAVYGTYSAGFWGFVWYGLAGLVAPAAVVWLGIVLCYCAVILGVFFAAWAAIIFGFFWLVGR
jgi:hypothetical protein